MSKEGSLSCDFDFWSAEISPNQPFTFRGEDDTNDIDGASFTKALRLTHASLSEPTGSDKEMISVSVTRDNKKSVICNLIKGSIPDAVLDLVFAPFTPVTFSVSSSKSCKVFLTGYETLIEVQDKIEFKDDGTVVKMDKTGTTKPKSKPSVKEDKKMVEMDDSEDEDDLDEDIDDEDILDDDDLEDLDDMDSDDMKALMSDLSKKRGEKEKTFDSKKKGKKVDFADDFEEFVDDENSEDDDLEEFDIKKPSMKKEKGKSELKSILKREPIVDQMGKKGKGDEKKRKGLEQLADEVDIVPNFKKNKKDLLPGKKVLSTPQMKGKGGKPTFEKKEKAQTPGASIKKAPPKGITGQFKCTKCSRTFMNEKGLTQHNDAKHSDAKNKK